MMLFARLFFLACVTLSYFTAVKCTIPQMRLRIILKSRETDRQFCKYRYQYHHHLYFPLESLASFLSVINNLSLQYSGVGTVAVAAALAATLFRPEINMHNLHAIS